MFTVKCKLKTTSYSLVVLFLCPNANSKMRKCKCENENASYDLQNANSKVQIPKCKSENAKCKLRNANCKFQTQNSILGIMMKVVDLSTLYSAFENPFTGYWKTDDKVLETR